MSCNLVMCRYKNNFFLIILLIMYELIFFFLILTITHSIYVVRYRNTQICRDEIVDRTVFCTYSSKFYYKNGICCEFYCPHCDFDQKKKGKIDIFKELVIHEK